MSTEPDDGGPAFPVVAANGLGHITDGMSLRDWFAGMALLKARGKLYSEDYDGPIPTMEEDVAEGCYRMADAMLKERDK